MLYRLFFVCVLMASFISCSDNDVNIEEESTENEIVILKVDYLTHTFEGGKGVNYPDANNFTITSNYNPPGDFGDIQLYYDEVDELLFDGTIIWMGLGERSVPSNLMEADNFSITDMPNPLPDSTLFEKVMYDQYAFYPSPTDYEGLWEAIDQLEIVYTIRNENPNGTIHLFLYTPSVGVGNPADWDWYVFMQN